MSSVEAFFLGLMQGLTEFLPISSSAHLKLVKLFLGIQEGESQVVFDLICHLGTLSAILWFLRKDLLLLVKGERRSFFLLFIATLPLIPFYFLLKPLRQFASQTSFLGYFLILTAFILFLGQRLRIQNTKNSKMKDVLCIGAMQSLALIPGISRSASTISTAQVLGWSPKEAVRFSFLLSIPTIIGGNCLELLKVFFSSQITVSISFSSCLIGFLSSLGVGIIVIGYAFRFLEKGNLKPFAWYCLTLGILTTLYLNFFYG